MAKRGASQISLSATTLDLHATQTLNPTPPNARNPDAALTWRARARFLDVEGVREVLAEMQRLMPNQDARAALARDPSWLTRVERGVKRLGAHPDDI